MGIPQIIMLAIYFLDLGISISKHGEPKTGKENFFVTLIGLAINATILYYGGFWN